MSTEMQTKVQVSPVQNFTPVQTGLLQKKSALCNTPGLVEDSGRDQEKLTLQHSSADQAGTTMVPRFGHDFSRVRVHSTGQGMIQTKLKINEPGDIYEQEADRVADAVMRMPEPGVQRDVEPEEEERLQAKLLVNQITPLVHVQRREETEEEEEKEPIEELEKEEEEGEEVPIMTKGIPGRKPQIRNDLQMRLNQSRDVFQPLPKADRSFMERNFDVDFSNVRVHKDSNAVQMTRELNAQAFTYGRDIYFGAGRYNPRSLSGKRLLAHELTHVLQQNGLMKAKRGGTKNAINYQINSSRIQRYRIKNVHEGMTKIYAEKVFGPGPISKKIAEENKQVDLNWTHPTITSVYSFLLPYYNKIKKPIGYLGFVGLLPRLIGKGIKYLFRKVNQKIKTVNPSIKSSDVLHFPKRQDAIVQVKLAIQNAKNYRVPFKQHAAKFGKVLHVYQDSFSHSFPSGSPYNRITNRHFKKQGIVAEFLSRRFTNVLRSVEKKYKPSLYGKGAVIRHLILGDYPDDYLEHGEQSGRDMNMLLGSVIFLHELKRSYNIWKKSKAKTRP